MNKEINKEKNKEKNTKKKTSENIKNIFIYIISIPKKLELLLIVFYKKHVSKHLGNRCRFYPTCSEYTRQAVDKYGIIKGNWIALKRIIKCHPFSKGGIDYLK